VDRKLVLAAARAHLESGLTIAAHTGDGVAALDQLDTLRRNGIDPGAWIWVHAQNEQDETLHARAAEAGAWVEFDGISPAGLDSHLAQVRAMRQRGLLNRVLLSHDAGWYHVGEPGGGQYRSHETLFTQFLPALRQSGFREEELDRMLVRNPADAFGIRVRDA
jgi:phosphotriesterase-related protein